MAANGRLRSKASAMSHASALPLAPGLHFGSGGEDLRSVTDLRRADLPPCVAALRPCPRIDFDFDHIGAIRALGSGEGRLESCHIRYQLGACAHRAGVHREVDGERGVLPFAIGDLIVERDIAGIALKLVNHCKAAVIAHDNDELPTGQYTGIDV